MWYELRESGRGSDNMGWFRECERGSENAGGV